MFSILNTNLNKVTRKNFKPLIPERRDGINCVKKKVKIENIVGTKYRSRNGCTYCKSKKRKCDEGTPCGLCVKKGIECQYKHKTNNSAGNILIKSKLLDITDKSSEKDPVDNISEKALILFDKSGQTSDYVVDDKIEEINICRTPKSYFEFFNDEKVKYFVDFFEHKVSPVLAVTTEDYNYFSKLFHRLATHEKLFTMLICAWGALYSKDRKVDNEVKHYLNQSLVSFNSNFNNINHSTNSYFKIVYYLMLIGFNICSGDVNVWDELFTELHQIIVYYGGLLKLGRDFNYSNEIIFLILNFQYHDLMSCNSFAFGTKFLMLEYKQVLNELHFKESEYGLDTLQGLNHPILTVMGEIINDVNGLEPIDSEVLWYRINHVTPNYQLVKLLSESDQLLHVNSFEIYRSCCKIMFKLYVQHTKPKYLHSLLLETIDKFNHLLGTRMTIILCLPLILCGVLSYTDDDKQRLASLYSRIEDICAIDNVIKSWNLIQKFWLVNDGDFIVNWSAVCNSEYGNLCVV